MYSNADCIEYWNISRKMFIVRWLQCYEHGAVGTVVAET
jgi:hypothetical protein